MSCTSKKENELPLFNELSFKMSEGESNNEINSESKNLYFKYFNNQNIQVPLFRHISHKNYQIFIGIPFNSSIEAMTQAQSKKIDSMLINFKSDTSSFYNKYKVDEIYITEYAAKFASKSLIYISTMSDSRALTDSLFNELALSKRIIIRSK